MIKKFLAASVFALAASSAFAVNDMTISSSDALGNFIEMRAAQPDDSTVAAEATPKSGGLALGERFARLTGRAERLVDASLNLIGVGYKWGGNREAEGFDCSGFVKSVFESSIGMSLPRTALEMSRRGQKVEKNELRPGDLVFFNTMRRTFSHVGIYLGANRFIHAPRTGAVIRVENMDAQYWQKRFSGARRVDNLGDMDVITSLSMQSAHDVQVK